MEENSEKGSLSPHRLNGMERLHGNRLRTLLSELRGQQMIMVVKEEKLQLEENQYSEKHQLFSIYYTLSKCGKQHNTDRIYFYSSRNTLEIMSEGPLLAI